MILIRSTSCLGQYTIVNSRSFGLAEAEVASSGFGSIYTNVAGIARDSTSWVSVNFFKHAPLPAFQTLGISGVYTKKLVKIGLSIDNFGDSDYHETRAGLAFGIQKDKVSMGVKFSYLNYAVSTLQTKQTVLGEFGILAKLNSKWNAGLRLTNFTSARVFESQSLPTLLVVGFQYKLFEKAAFTTQYDYFVSQNGHFRFGFMYLIRPTLEIQTGANPNLKSVHFGLQYQYKGLYLQIASAYSPIQSMGYQFSTIKRLHK
ncbi:MAG: hypothetical protein ACRCVT_11200 [Leadbetterella sp.]